MKKSLLKSLTFWWILVSVVMLILGLSGGIIWDKQDWIFLFLFVGIIILNVKLNEIIKLLSKKKK